MAATPDSTVLQIQCGTCMQVLNVPASLLESLLGAKEYSCPKCSSRQAIHLRGDQEVSLRHQARQILHNHAMLYSRQPPLPAPVAPHRPPFPRPFPLPHHRPQIQQRPALPRPGGFRPPLPRPPSSGQLNNVAAMRMAQAHFEQQQRLRQQQQQEQEEEDDIDEGEVRETFLEYKPAKLPYGKPHPDPVVETASLASVDPPNITYELKAYDLLVGQDKLSALQLESIVYACQRHEQRLPDGSRAAFFIGDGAGVGKGRTIAGLILENWMQGRKRHIWISVGSDLKFDSRRDLDDAGAEDIPVHALNKLPYSKLDSNKVGITEGVIFLTYSSLISSSEKGRSRFKQLIEWCGKNFDGLVVFDESHKAKNLVAETGSKSTQVGLRVKDLQTHLPSARIVYCSATGASEPRNMGYMVRLGLWGDGHAAFRDFGQFLDAVQGKGVSQQGAMATLELVAMDMKAHGMYVSRTLSFAGAEFETIETPLEQPIDSQYAKAAEMWNMLYREFLYAEEQNAQLAATHEEVAAAAAAAASDGEGNGNPSTATGATVGGTKKAGEWRGGSAVWRYFWAAHQRFFRHMCMAAKVPAVVRMAHAALANDKCVVIGLQSTGEARTTDVLLEKGEELDDFVSGPKELLLKLVEDQYPLPPDPYDEFAEAGSSSSDEEFEGRGTRTVAEAVARGMFEMRETSRRQLGREVRYKEYHSDEDIGITSSSSSDNDERSQSGSASGKGSESDDERTATNNRVKDSDPSFGMSSDVLGSESSEDDDDDEGENEMDESVLSPAALKRLQDRRARREQKLALKEAKRLAEEAERIQKERALVALSAAIKRRDELRALIAEMELPPNPLDDLIDRLGGPSKVAEMTGRKGRLVRDEAAGTVKYEPRNASGTGAGATLELINVHERGLFLNGDKYVAVISEAASAGISLHADRRVRNQRRRVHLTLELPWSADKAIQQFGRSHRANQAHGPQYRLVFTPLGGEKRFASAVARRLESLGALTQGDRRAGPSLAAFNYESTWGQRALREMYAVIVGEKKTPAVLPVAARPGPDGEPAKEKLEHCLGRLRANLLNCGLLRPNRSVVNPLEMNKCLTSPEGAPENCGTLDDRDRIDVPRFLNRILGLDPDSQAEVFDYFQATMDDLVHKARREGTLDEGIMDMKARSITVQGEPQTLNKDPVSGAATLLYTVNLDKGLPWDDAKNLLVEHEERLRLEDEGGLMSPARPAALLAAVPVAAGNDASQQQQQQQQKGGGDVDMVLEMSPVALGGASLPASSPAPAEEEAKPAAPAVVDTTTSVEEVKEEAEDNNRASKRQRTEKSEDEDVVDLTKDSDDDDDDDDEEEDNDEPKRKPWQSGFYRARQGEKSRGFVLLALRVPESAPATFTIYRPGTGRTKQLLSLADLKAKYMAISFKACEPLWNKVFEAAAVATKEKPAIRLKTVHVLCGAVMRSWGAVQRVLVRQVKSKERKVKVLRIVTTEEEPQRLIGMLVPEAVVKKVVGELTAEEEEDKDKEEQQNRAKPTTTTASEASK